MCNENNYLKLATFYHFHWNTQFLSKLYYHDIQIERCGSCLVSKNLILKNEKDFNLFISVQKQNPRKKKNDVKKTQ